jgi:nicotinamidase-related amidase
VSFTCKDAARAGFNVFCVLDGCRGIAPGTVDGEVAAMRAAGVTIVASAADVPTAAVEDILAAEKAERPADAPAGAA